MLGGCSPYIHSLSHPPSLGARDTNVRFIKLLGFQNSACTGPGLQFSTMFHSSQLSHYAKAKAKKGSPPGDIARFPPLPKGILWPTAYPAIPIRPYPYSIRSYIRTRYTIYVFFFTALHKPTEPTPPPLPGKATGPCTVGAPKA